MKILLVDHDRELVELLSFGLLQAGFWPLPAYTGAQALDLLATADPALVLLDAQLEGESGLDLLRDMRLRTDVPIIMLSAVASDDDRLRAFDLGADDYLIKPFGIQELLARIRARLRRVQPPTFDASPAVVLRFLARWVTAKATLLVPAHMSNR